MIDLIEQSRKVTSILANNRTENIGQDVWDEFVVPRYFDKYDFYSKMPCLIEGGRGCGKTMLLRFLSYQSQFSPKRCLNEKQSLENIGLYWRADTAFLRQFSKRGISSDTWKNAFKHYLSLKVSLEVFKSIEYVVTKLDIKDFQLDKFIDLDVYDSTLVGNFESIKKALTKLIKKLEISISNPSMLEDVIFFSFEFTKDVITEVKSVIPELRKTCFHIFLDEYENLLTGQQEIINTAIKHSEEPIIFKIACKKNGMPCIETEGDEAIQKKHDYIVHDLDQYTDYNDYNLFAAEVLLSRISRASNIEDNISLNNVSNLSARREDKYKKEILTRVRLMLPGKKQCDLANDVFSKTVLKNKLKSMISQALAYKENTSLTASDFVNEDQKEASIVCSALLNRESIIPEELLEKFNSLLSGNKNAFGDWISTNFIGCYINIIHRWKPENRLYCGFETFISLSKGNLRHFLELCRTSFSGGYSFNNNEFYITEEIQAFSAEQASVALFEEIKSFKPFGNALYIFMHRLGSIFSIYQSRLSQSEPEITHFSIDGGATLLSQQNRKLLDECEKWGLLYKTTATKTKNKENIDDYDWVLNPIYAPRFLISYRKKRKIILSSYEIDSLFSEDSSGYETLSDKVKKHILPTKKNNKTTVDKLINKVGDLPQRDLFDV